MKNKEPYITVFTPTYNRAYILPKLYHSLKQQTVQNFEWIVVNDGSTDETRQLVQQWQSEKNPFEILLHNVENGGKPRAINRGLQAARGKYFVIVDSDDYLLADAIEKITSWVAQIDSDPAFIGVGTAKGYPDHTYIKGRAPKVGRQGYVDATNLERARYDLDVDGCEAYKTEILRKYPFFVWPGETFVPEQIVLNQIALDGYRLRWFPDIIYICDYLEDGLTRGSKGLEKNNPMGYAMMYNHMLKYDRSLKHQFYCTVQMEALAFYAKHPEYLFQCNAKWLAIFALPAGLVLAIRRAIQFGKG